VWLRLRALPLAPRSDLSVEESLCELASVGSSGVELQLGNPGFLLAATLADAEFRKSPPERPLFTALLRQHASQGKHKTDP
jgi:hypothetical protein